MVSKVVYKIFMEVISRFSLEIWSFCFYLLLQYLIR
jgi:hypothetical protein